MLTKEDVDSWNKLFPDCQINKSNLTHPTEHFLTIALVCYLRRFGYNVEPPFSLNAENKDNNKENRLFLIKLARQIDHFLKITDKSYAFTYYDLIRPTPKKTAHMLYILLNYYFYYNMYKEKVIKMAGERKRKLEDLKALIDDTRRDNDHRKEEAVNIKTTIENLMEELPLARKTLKELNTKRTVQEENIQKINHAYQELKEKLKHFEEQKNLLRKRDVPDEESQELRKQLEILKSELAQHKQMEQKNEENLKESKDSSAKLQYLSKDIEKAREIIPLHLLEQSQELNKQLEKVKKELNEVEAKQNIMIQQIEEETQALELLEQQQQSKKQEYEIKQNELLKQHEAKRHLQKQKNIQIIQLEKEDHVLECQLEEQKDISEYLKENIKEILEYYED